MNTEVILKKPFCLTSEQASLSCEFMRVFSRFECALKQSGYARQRGNQ